MGAAAGALGGLRKVVAGGTAHVLELLGNNKLIRPESAYLGPRDVPYLPLDARG